jgi:hypothetical protein
VNDTPEDSPARQSQKVRRVSILYTYIYIHTFIHRDTHIHIFIDIYILIYLHVHLFIGANGSLEESPARQSEKVRRGS